VVLWIVWFGRLKVFVDGLSVLWFIYLFFIAVSQAVVC